MKKGLSFDRIAQKNDTYDEMADANRKAATDGAKMSPRGAGALATGFNPIKTPAQPTSAYHAQTKAERNTVAGPYSSDNGKQHKGKASPSSEESWVKTKKNHEYSEK